MGAARLHDSRADPRDSSKPSLDSLQMIGKINCDSKGQDMSPLNVGHIVVGQIFKLLATA
jgi:hypothetical protein